MATYQPTVLITGCSRGGVGDALALEFAARGYHVLAGLRNPSKANDYASLSPLSSKTPASRGRVEVVTLDVTSSASIKSLVDDLSSRLPDGKLDVLINNAGHGLNGPAIEADLDAARKLFDVNFWAVLAMAQAFLPMLVKAKGKLVNVSSIGSLLTIPWIGFYASSKAALTSISETLRLELVPLGVTVVTGMVGHIETNFDSNSGWTGLPDSSRYKAIEDQVGRTARGEIGNGRSKVEDFARQFVDDVVGGASGQVFRGKNASISRFMGYHLPSRLMDSLLVPGSGLDVLTKTPVAE